MTPDPPTQAEPQRPARVAIPEALAADVAARPEAYRPDVDQDADILVLAADVPDLVGGQGQALDTTTDSVALPVYRGAPGIYSGSALAWALVGSVDGITPRPADGARVLALAGECAGRVVRIASSADAGTAGLWCEWPDDTAGLRREYVTRWALLPPPAADEAAPAPTDAPGTSEPADLGRLA